MNTELTICNCAAMHNVIFNELIHFLLASVDSKDKFDSLLS